MTAAKPGRRRKHEEPETFKVWVRMGIGLHASFIEAIEKYSFPPDDGGRWMPATLTLDRPPPLRKGKRA